MHVFTIAGEERQYDLVRFALEDVIRATLAIHFDNIKEESDFRHFLRIDCDIFIESNKKQLKVVNDYLCEIAATMGCRSAKKLPLEELVLGIIGGIAEEFWTKMFGEQKQ